MDGRPADGADVGLGVAARTGHFTAMQIRDHRVRGLDLHLERLSTATAELFGEQLDRDLVVASLRAVLGDDLPDASVRVNVLRTDRLHVIVSTGAPVEAPTAPQRLMSVGYQRFLPHIKHGGGFPSVHLGRQAEAAGFDEVLFVAADGTISEGGITNLGCFDGTRVIWPYAPMLHGITMQIMERALTGAGVPQERRPLRLADLPSFETVFLTNSYGVSPVGQVDDVPLKSDVTRLVALYEDTPWDPI